ncbi:TetR/AcrR family transcriptional regulator [Bosea sp. BK604]|uniref:TetR/AcrR family transcriptional regulator n=1 Tax=Bosea sp. BK604 TaxID=2512180 RepID=UPI00104D5D2D|nr:TetR/AcrR family transcriptional regulator [Bosea sp. BK604]TCR66172.1 TetR family transcriptional regulator [Bosea sp. BK604]
MARPREFDRDTALAQAIAVFCEHGYEGSSTAMLLDAMAISRQSLYDTFGDKRKLYIEALQRYIADSVAEQIRSLNAAPSALKGIEATLLAFAAKAAVATAPGCMGLGATCEFGRSDQEITLLIETADRTLTSAFEHRLVAAKATGEIAADLDMRAATDFLKATLAGIKLAARGGALPEALSGIARMAIRSLR